MTDHAPESDTSAWSFETKQVHAGAVPDPTTGSRAVPIYQTTSYVFPRHRACREPIQPGRAGQHLHAHRQPDERGCRGTPHCARRGVASVALASGQATETLTVLTLAGAGDHLVSSASLYGGTYNLFHYTLPKIGIEVTFVDDPDNFDEWRAAARPNTKLFFAETIGNPRGNVLDIEGVAGIAHEVGVPLVVDNTVPTPYVSRPIEHGADIIVHSATKFIGGHGTVIAGIVVDGGTFDFGAHADRFPGFVEPDPSYGGLRYWPALGPGAFAAKLSTAPEARLRTQLCALSAM